MNWFNVKNEKIIEIKHDENDESKVAMSFELKVQKWAVM